MPPTLPQYAETLLLPTPNIQLQGYVVKEVLEGHHLERFPTTSDPEISAKTS